ncbi:MAG: histidinol dehydrogenase [Dehalococcoidia bacterium]|nr:histidinol dehydrogenase [Dehalococcoidia bacterium]MDH4367945.1 histidinol dehydrogenase [Dehalococcoidia bacterium]
MRRVRGLGKARQLLARENFWEPFTTSQGLAPQTKHVFLSVQKAVDRIIGDVRDKGDKALFDYTEKLDGVRLDSLEVDKREIVAARKAIDKKLVSALKFAAGRIRDFHAACEHKTGLIPIDRHLGQQILPLRRVGFYVPGGSAAYPSTVLMMAIPARVAGVEDIIMVSPPGKDGKIPAATLVAADIAKVNRIFKIGGAQAIAALAFGTESIPRVDKICGPGNIFVTLAKKMVYGTVDIDGLEGPSEIVIVADEKAKPALCAADLLAQAEHDPLASVVLITTSADLAKRVDKEIEMQLGKLKRRSTIRKAVDAGMLVLVDDMSQAVELVNLFAPEHLSIMTSNASALVRKIHNAGCIFVAENSPVVLGDYVAGPSHVLPTGGTARFGSPLGVADFLKVTNIIALDRPAMRKLSQPAVEIAKAEGLDAHAQAVGRRLKAKQKIRM